MFAIRGPKLLADTLWTIAIVGATIAVDILNYGVVFRNSDWMLPEELRPPFVDQPWNVALGSLALFLNCAAQELIFRGYFLARFTEVTRSVAGGVVLSTMCFASIHLFQGTDGVVASFYFGLICCFVVIRTKSLWAVTVAHTLVNAIYFGLLG